MSLWVAICIAALVAAGSGSVCAYLWLAARYHFVHRDKYEAILNGTVRPLYNFIPDGQEVMQKAIDSGDATYTIRYDNWGRGYHLQINSTGDVIYNGKVISNNKRKADSLMSEIITSGLLNITFESIYIQTCLLERPIVMSMPQVSCMLSVEIGDDYKYVFNNVFIIDKYDEYPEVTDMLVVRNAVFRIEEELEAEIIESRSRGSSNESIR
jgi:hypothetical protein